MNTINRSIGALITRDSFTGALITRDSFTGALILAALFASGPRANAQFGLFDLVSPFQPAISRLGQPLAMSVGNWQPFIVVNPGGVTPGFLGPDGSYSPPSQAFDAYYNGPGVQGPAGPDAPQGNMPPNVPSLASPAATDQQTPSTTGSAGGFNGNGTVSVQGDNVKIQASGDLYGSPLIPRTSDSIEARIEKDNRLFIRWSGEPRAVARITFALLDKDHHVIKHTIVTRLPAQAYLTLTSRTSYYQVYVEYVNGTTTSLVSPL